MRVYYLALGLVTLIALASPAIAQPPSFAPWTVPEVSALPRDNRGQLIRDGRDVMLATYAHIGPNVADAAKRYAGNNLACTNCHLDGGTKKFSLPLFGIYDDFPAYSARTGGPISIEDRINGCMTRSMNGRALTNDAPEMRAMVAYVEFLSTGVPKGERLPGLGAGRMKELSRPADPVRGRAVYARLCAACHKPDGLGVLRDRGAPELGYMLPPLWGPDSFNTGAGMNRLVMATRFVKANMPLGASHEATQLSDDEAYDVSAYMVSQPRPAKARLEADFPARWIKPVDAAFPPDLLGSADQHKYGPFAPLAARQKQLAEQLKAQAAARTAAR